MAGDHIYLYWPNNIDAQNSQISKTTSSQGSTSLMIKMADSIHELYEGMKIAGSSDKHILSLDKSVNEITTNIAHGIGNDASVTFDHHASLGDDASAGWTGIHRVKSASANGREIKIIVPNSGTKGDLTINSSAGPKSAVPTGSSIGAYIVKVKNGKGRFVRPITSGITSADAFFFNSGTTDVEYSFGSPSQTYVIKPGTAQLLFSLSLIHI